MDTKKRIVIVGGVAGGASAAARARRRSEEAEIVLFERGDHVSFANCGLPYHIGGAIADREKLLVQTPESLRRRFGLDVRIGTEVVSIDRENKTVVARTVADGSEVTERYDALILSPGAGPIIPPIPGIDHPSVFTLRNIDDMDAIKSVVDGQSPQQAVVIGGGYIGLEMAEALRDRNVPTTLVELAPQVLGPLDAEMATPLHQELTKQGVTLKLGVSVNAVEDRGGQATLTLSNGETLESDLTILCVGVRPETTLAKQAGLTLGETGGIAVDAHMQTNDPAIFAVGDAVEVENFVSRSGALIPLAGPANRQGRIAADNALAGEGVASYTQTQGTGICKVFGLAAGMVGLNAKQLQAIGREYETVYVHPMSHASYYPGASPMSLKLLFDPATGLILGAQAVGADGVDKRIDVLAVAQRAGMTVFDLESLELSYAPPYGSAKDPVNYAGFVAANAMRGDCALCHFEDVAAPNAGQFILDVRTAGEVAKGTIPGATNIPVDQLRSRLGELPRDKEILVTCQVGLRGYIGCRILMQNGFSCRNLTGGYKTYRMTASGSAFQTEC